MTKALFLFFLSLLSALRGLASVFQSLVQDFLSLDLKILKPV